MVKSKETRLLNRREFGGLCVALSSFVISPGASALMQLLTWLQLAQDGR